MLFKPGMRKIQQREISSGHESIGQHGRNSSSYKDQRDTRKKERSDAGKEKGARKVRNTGKESCCP